MKTNYESTLSRTRCYVAFIHCVLLKRENKKYKTDVANLLTLLLFYCSIHSSNNTQGNKRATM